MLTYTKISSSCSVNDLGAAKTFYGKVIGLPVSETPEGLSVAVAGDFDLFLYPKPNHTPATYTVLTIEVPDIDKAVDQLTTAGVVFNQYQGELQTDEKGIARNLPHGPLAAWFTDPAGNVLGVMQSRKN
jgi:predicted enzyme related to lactoylglutathione lyase